MHDSGEMQFKMQLIDTHVHLNFDQFKDNLPQVRARWQEAGIVHLIHSCVEPQEFQSIQAIANQIPEISFAVGLHPLDVDKWTEQSVQEILRLAQSDHRVVAIGEMGLDLYKGDNVTQQIQVLEAQLSIAKQLNLPVIIHCRDGAVLLRDILAKFISTQGTLTGVMHCWGGSPEETQWFLDLGFYVSFSGVVTFNKAQQVQASAQLVPSDRILVETDCPFLAPVPKRGKPNEPSYVRYVAECVANLRQTPLETFASQTTANACSLFRINKNF
jgi:TatD DNase family protein